jgi:hypothetical protein
MMLILFLMLNISELFSKYDLIVWFEIMIDIVNVSNLIDITNVWFFVITNN